MERVFVSFKNLSLQLRRDPNGILLKKYFTRLSRYETIAASIIFGAFLFSILRDYNGRYILQPWTSLEKSKSKKAVESGARHNFAWLIYSSNFRCLPIVLFFGVFTRIEMALRDRKIIDTV